VGDERSNAEVDTPTESADGLMDALPTALADRLGLFEQAVAATSTGIVISDARQPDLPIIFANSTFYRMTGYAPDETLGRNCRFLQGPETSPAAVDRIRTALRDGRDCTVTLRNYRRDGAPFWNELTLSPVHAAKGELTHYVGVQMDVSARVRAEKEREDLLAREREARAMAEAATRMRDYLFATAAHDLRSPLAAAIATAQLQQRRLDRGRELSVVEQQERLATMRDLIERALSTVDEIADAARLQGGQTLDLRRESVDVGALVREAARVVGAAHGLDAASAMSIELDLPATPPTVDADRARLERALRNVIGNAVKYSPGGTPVRVSVDVRDNAAVVVVRDSGVGIPAAELPHVFTPFYRASTAHGIDGTGLGLVGARTIVEQHGGTITLDSAVGQGSTVVVTLPLRAS